MGRRGEGLHNFGEFVRHIFVGSVQYLKKSSYLCRRLCLREGIIEIGINK